MKRSLRLAAATIVMAAALSACGDDEPAAPVEVTSAPTPTSTATLTGASTDEVNEASDLFGQLVGVRVGDHPGFDRVVLEFAKDVPGYSIKYVELPVTEDGSGEPVDLPGADFAVQIVMTPASGFDMEAGKATYTGPKTVSSDKTAEITGVVDSGDFESLLSWAVGLRHEVPFKVTKLSNPARLVVDFQTS
ncbi:hypothetical protein GCM10022234_24490 [Aeromicrobium panaciterrae]|uniref:AMIN-like domain-containing (lipo)protein n=1 Tax=Aeromicrobium panaciterrae TaxID=363861 RepID=UPI0031D695C3